MRKSTPSSICVAARTIWADIRNAELGNRLDRERHELRIESEILRVVEPFRLRSEKCGRDRRRAVTTLNEACRTIATMKKALCAVAQSKGHVERSLIDTCKRLAGVNQQAWMMPVDDEPPQDEQPTKDDVGALPELTEEED